MKTGKLIVLEGTDGSGKATQAELLRKGLEGLGYKAKSVDFPRYSKESASLIKEYLNGKYGSAKEVGPQKASLFYAIDRFAASAEMRKWLAEGYIVIADRYVSSNKAHQSSKIRGYGERKKFVKWVNELEYEILEVPRPNVTIFLNVYPEKTRELIKERGNKKDIHEIDNAHTIRTYNCYLELIRGLDNVENWKSVNCYNGRQLLGKEEIARRVLNLTKKYT